MPDDANPLIDTVTGKYVGYNTGLQLPSATVTFDPLAEKLKKEAEERNRITEETLKFAAKNNVMSNDATHIGNAVSSPQNLHLLPQGMEGAESHALWEREHPYLTQLGYAAGAAPFAVAAAPAVAVGGDALAGTALGQGITALATNPYIDALATSYAGADLFNKYQNGYRFGQNLWEDAATVGEAVPVVGYAPKVARGVESTVNNGTALLRQYNPILKAENTTSLGKAKGFNFGIKTEDLPKYAKPKSSENPLNLHISRLQKEWQFLPVEDANKNKYFLEPVDNNGTFAYSLYKKDGGSPTFRMYAYDNDAEGAVTQLSDDMAQSALPNYTEEDLPFLHEFFKPKAEISLTTDRSPLVATSSTGNIYLKQHGLSLSKPFGKIENLISHEVDHAIHIPTEPPKGFNPSAFSGNYFSHKNGTELAARGSQIKDYFGLSDNQPITENMLKYAAEHYVEDTGTDNNMTDFFNLITDWKKAAEWLTKFSTAIIPPAFLKDK